MNTPRWAPHKLDNKYSAEVVPQEWELRVPHQAPQPGVLQREDEPPEHLAPKASRASFQESQRIVGNRDFTLKGHIENSHAPGRLKGAWVRPTCWSWRASQRSRRQLELTLETQTLAVAISRSFFYHMDGSAGSIHSGISSLLAPGPGPTHQSVLLILGCPRPSN